MKPDTLLAISTGSAALSVALFDAGVCVARSHELIGRGHAEALIGTVARVMNDAGIDRASAVLVDIGPGSFTGVRIGVAAARALALAWAAPVHGCTAAALIAARAFAEAQGLESVTVSLDAGRGQRYLQDIDRDYSAGPIVVASANTFSEHPLVTAEPDAAFALLLPLTQCCLPPAPLYVRPPDAVLPL